MAMNPHAASPAAHGSSVYSINDVLNFPATIDLLDDVDFESTMMMLDTPNSPSLSPYPYRRDSAETIEHGIAETFAAHDAESRQAPNLPAALGGGGRPSFSPALKIRRPSATTPSIKQEVTGEHDGNQSAVAVKQEPIAHGDAPDLTPIIDSFLRESWEDIFESGQRTAARTTFRAPLGASTTPGRVNPLPLSFFLPGPVLMPTPSLVKNGQVSLPSPPMAFRTISNASTASSVSTASSTASGSRRSARRAKQCVIDGCTRRAQSNNRCKTHGGGARCQVEGCNKSSQGGGLCRAHGGGKKCRVPGCTKGTQRLGLCYLHGGIRRCITEGCKKKDRGNGYCISHGGGRRCEVDGCTRSVRKGNHCQMHQEAAGSCNLTS